MSNNATIPFALTGTGTGVKQQLQLAGSPHQFTAVGHQNFGGDDSAPSPVDYALGALTSCTQVTAQIIAAQDPSILLGAWTIKLNSNLKSGVLLYGEEGLAGFADLHLEINVETNLDDAQFAIFASETERRCPIAQLFLASGVQFTSNWNNLKLQQAA